MIKRQLHNIATIIKTTPQKNIGLFSSQANQQHQHDLIYGINPIEAALHADRRKLIKLMVSDSDRIELSSRLAKIIHLARDKHIQVAFSPKDKLNRIVKDQPHQNVVLKCSKMELVNWEFSQQLPQGLSLYCDKITDPQNFGAILRSALFYGVSAVFTGRKNHCPLNSTVSKTSSGAMELMNIHAVGNSTDFVNNWRQKGGTVISTGIDTKKQHTKADQIGSVIRAEGLQNILLILGSEGKGVSPHLLQLSDFTVAIQRKGPNDHPFSIVDSLNVSAAASTLLFELTRK